MSTPSLVILACGALAREIVALKRMNHWEQVDVTCLPAKLHNRPEQIAEAVKTKLDQLQERYDKVFVAYADCGTGGVLDRVLDEYGVERIPGTHCYEFFAGSRLFAQLSESEPGTFYLTDFLARHFERLVWQGMGMDRYPELLQAYFGNYRKLVYLSQTPQDDLLRLAEAAAERLGLAFEHRVTGYGELANSLEQFYCDNHLPINGHSSLINAGD